MTSKLKKEKTIELKVKEPSGICTIPGSKDYLVVSDRGKLYRIDKKGKKILKFDYEGDDFEGVYADSDYAYVIDEGTRKLHLLSLTSHKKVKSVKIPFEGKKNKGFEGITFNEYKNCWVLATEKSPSLIYELNLDYSVAAVIENKAIKEVSDITWYDNAMWFLSDEEKTIYKTDPVDYSIKQTWTIKVDNPEGICFSSKEKLIIISDEDQEMYIYPNPLKP